MIEEIVLNSACLVNENSWSIDNWLTLVSIIITAIFSRMMWYVAKTQKDIQEKQKNLELFKLRFKHEQDFISISSKLIAISSFIDINNVSESKIEIKNNSSLLLNIVAESKYLFNQEVFKIENSIFIKFERFYDILNKEEINKIIPIKMKLIMDIVDCFERLKKQYESFFEKFEI